MRKQPGFTLVEVLVTLVVLAVGLLGLAALQSVTLRSSNSAVYRSQATNLAYYIADCMRVNRGAAINGDYVISPIPTPPACTKSSTGSALSGATIALKDIDAWQKTLACVLPQGTGGIGAVAQNGTSPALTYTVTITVQWDDSRGEILPQQFAMTTNL